MGIKWEIYERAPASVMTPMLLKKKNKKDIIALLIPIRIKAYEGNICFYPKHMNERK